MGYRPSGDYYEGQGEGRLFGDSGAYGEEDYHHPQARDPFEDQGGAYDEEERERERRYEQADPYEAIRKVSWRCSFRRARAKLTLSPSKSRWMSIALTTKLFATSPSVHLSSCALYIPLALRLLTPLFFSHIAVAKHGHSFRSFCASVFYDSRRAYISKLRARRPTERPKRWPSQRSDLLLHLSAQSRRSLFTLNPPFSARLALQDSSRCSVSLRHRPYRLLSALDGPSAPPPSPIASRKQVSLPLTITSAAGRPVAEGCRSIFSPYRLATRV